MSIVFQKINKAKNAALFNGVVAKNRKDKIITLSLTFLILVICCFIPVAYVGNEHTIHFWDQAAYHDMSLAKALDFKQTFNFSFASIAQHGSKIYHSTARNYSDLHTILTAPFILLFGQSRIVYILSLSIIYLLPFSLIVGAIASFLVPFSKNTAFWTATFITVLYPTVWLPTLNGYPDTGSAFLIGSAIVLFLKDRELKKWWRIFLISLCLAITILFRRHFAYDVITFFVCVSLHHFITIVSTTRSSIFSILLLSSIRIGALAIVFLLVLTILGWPFVYRLTYTNFSDLYASYLRSPGDNFSYYLSFYGWVGVVIALAGYTWSMVIKKGPVLSSPITFLFLFGIISILQWFFIVSQLGVHYTLHFTPWVVVGIFLFTWLCWHALIGLSHKAAVVSIGIYLFTNFITTLTPTTIGNHSITKGKITNSILTTALPANFSPPQRNDYNEIIKLVEYLHSIASAKDPIYVAASSAIINDGLLWHANRNLYEDVMSYRSDKFWESERLNILQWIPFADSYDYYPIEKLLQSKFVLIATPTQYHMRIEEQDLITVVVKAFSENWPIAKDFKLLPTTFKLSNEVTVHIYERINHTTLQTAITTLTSMQDYLITPPGGQLNWIGLNNSITSHITKNRDESYKISANIAGQSAPVQFLYIPSNNNAKSSLQGSIDVDNKIDENTTINLRCINEKGEVTFSTSYSTSSSKKFKFNIAEHKSAFSFILLEINKPHQKINSGQWLNIGDLIIK